jgi:hypothetical protein
VVPTPPEAGPEPTPVQAQPSTPSLRDPRLPPVGSVIQRVYKGRTFEVLATETGFEHESTKFSSLSQLAKKITGQTVNGFVWWGLGHKDGKSRSGAGSARLAAKIRKIESLVGKLQQAMVDGQAALREAEAEVEKMKREAGKGQGLGE